MPRADLIGVGRERGRALLALALLTLGLLSPGVARAHSPTFAVYSKYEATTSDARVVFVFALDKAAVLALLEREVAHHRVEPAEIAQSLYGEFFSAYLFQRFSVSNDGAACTHPARVARFQWDELTKRVVAVTTFTCTSRLNDLEIRSRVSHDMPISHELVGDLQHGRALVRSFFRGDDTEAHIALASLPRAGTAAAPRARARNRVSYVAVPDEARRYEDLVRAELGADQVRDEAADVSPGRTLLHFVGDGVRHIFTGYDHVLFIVTLILSVGTWRRLTITVTAFTAAHSVTLVLATLGLVSIPATLVEPLIAASVLFVALDTALRPNAPSRAPVAFAFGLIHGFGLSSVLRDLGLSGRALVPALLGFNIGVEIGQLLIVTPLFALLLMLRRNARQFCRLRSVVAAGVAVLAVLWIVLRVRDALAG